MGWRSLGDVTRGIVEDLAREPDANDLTVTTDDTGWIVIDGFGQKLRGGFKTCELAWRWIDKQV